MNKSDRLDLDKALYGFSVTGPDGERIDPRSVHPAGFDSPMSAERECDASGKEAVRDDFGQPARTVFLKELPAPKEEAA